MAWRAHAASNNSSPPPAPTPVVTRQKPTMEVIAEIEKKREDRRKAMAAAKKERETENRLNEKLGTPGDVDFQRMIKYFRAQNKGKEVPHDISILTDHKITVCVRKRPVADRERKKRDYDAVTLLNPLAIVHDCKLKVDGITKYLDNNAFSFDQVFDEKATNKKVYTYTAQPLVDFVFQECGRATVFAYGQTGSGKTYTMQGIQKQIAEDLFAQVELFQSRGIPLIIGVSFFELYGGRCQDLLQRKVLSIREDGAGEVQVIGLEEVSPSSKEELLQIIARGNSKRTTHATEVNDVSSRSHCICQISIRESGSMALHGQLSLVDLAGSERGEDTKNHSRQRRLESSDINKSLLALKECFRALDSGGRNVHVPFRGSKLTQVLKDSFVNGNTKTVMIATVSPCASSADHTVNTLRYADRVKEKHVSVNAFDEIVSGAVVNVSLDDDEDEDMESPMESDNEDAGISSSPSSSPDPTHSVKGTPNMMKIKPHRRESKPNGVISTAICDDAKESKTPLFDKESDTSMQSPTKSDDLKLGPTHTLYECQEALLNAHMNTIQENAELLTEEGALLAEIQGDGVVDYDIDRYMTRLESILIQKAQSIELLRKNLTAFRLRCEKEEAATTSSLPKNSD